MDNEGAHPIFDAAYFRELAAKYEAADQLEVAAKLTQVAAQFEKRERDELVGTSIHRISGEQAH
jgi:hypothetical protein